MLRNQDIQALLETKSKTTNVTRAQRIMYCDNTVKDLFVYHIADVIKEEGVEPNSFEEQIEGCLHIFSEKMHNYFYNNEETDLKFFTPVIRLNLQILENAINELRTLNNMLNTCYTEDEEMIVYEMVKDIRFFNLPNYVAILEVLGIIDVNNNVYCSKILSRLVNMKDQIDNFMVKKMDFPTLISELKSHREFFNKQVNYIDKFKLYGEDFIVYPFIFDMRKNKENKHIKVLTI